MDKHNIYSQNLTEDEILDGIMRRQARQQQQLQQHRNISHQMNARESQQELITNTALASNLRDFQHLREQFALQQQQRQQQQQQQRQRQQQQQQQKLQQQQRETIRATVSVPPKIFNSTEPFSATLKTLSRERGGDPENNDLTNLLSSSFPHSLFVALEEAKYPNALKWSSDGKGFYTNPDHKTMTDALLHYFKRE
jgi:hypothetical protein